MTRGVYRIGFSDLKVYEVTKNSCKETKKDFSNAVHVAELFKANKNLKKIIDEKNKMFLMGSFQDGKTAGARIPILPNGEELDKPYPLFADNLTIHEEKSSAHWDVIFQNPSGKMTYIYTKKKKKKFGNKKYKKVEEFEKCLPRLRKKLYENLKKDPLALPIIILLKTKMRVGNELYYKKNMHKGLTTLKKQDIKIWGNRVTFDYIAKDGVPRKITDSFKPEVIEQLNKVLKSKKSNDFVFSKNSKPIKDTEFERAFKRFCGTSFYPHIIRSHFATEEAMKFLEKNKKPSIDEVKKFYTKIADKLGHMKFSKKKGSWQDSYQVTLNYYIKPSLVKKITKRVK